MLHTLIFIIFGGIVIYRLIINPHLGLVPGLLGILIFLYGLYRLQFIIRYFKSPALPKEMETNNTRKSGVSKEGRGES